MLGDIEAEMPDDMYTSRNLSSIKIRTLDKKAENKTEVLEKGK